MGGGKKKKEKKRKKFLALNRAFTHFALLSILCSLAKQEDGERRCLRSLGHIDDLLQTRDAKGDVLG